MEWNLAVNYMLDDEIKKIGPNLLPQGFVADIAKVRAMQECLGRLINELGEQSAAAQGLSKVITTADKLRNATTHIIYILKDAHANDGKGEVIGFLKIGRKHLYLFDDAKVNHEVEPVCVLDFYVRGDYQRKGLGKKLFDRMLEDECLQPYQLAIDGPSAKMEQFMAKNYGIDRLLRQNNNFAVSPLFFNEEGDGVAGQSGRLTPMSQPIGRFAAAKTPSTIATVIHRGGRSPQHPSDKLDELPRSASFSNLNLTEE